MARSTLLAVVLAVAGSLSPVVASARSFAAPPPSAAVASRPSMPADDDVPIPTVITLDRTKVMAQLKAARQANLDRFRAYAAGGVFPSNTYTGSSLNVWRDGDGHFCAAASVIAASGEGQLVIDTADQDNFIRLRNVTAGPLHDWMLTSGFTITEIDQIQRPFRPVAGRPLPSKPSPAIVATVEPAKRARETRRLTRLYKRIDRALVRHERAQLEAATDLLMANPDLAAAAFGTDAVITYVVRAA